MQINELARAKINLCLHVTGQRADGYHLLDSIVVFADIGDQITVEPSDGFSLTINGPFAHGLSAGNDNLVLQAAQLFSKNCKGAAITLTKNLPVASGIGGGSADAAATLRAMSRMAGAPLPTDAGLSLGADVPVCLQSVSCRMQGIGEQITPLSDIPKLASVLACPKAGVATASIFSAIKGKENPPVSRRSANQGIYGYLSKQRNDLEVPAKALVKEIEKCLDQIKDEGALLARMSGSGATCFGLFKSQKDAQNAARALSDKYPEWWVKACSMGN
ncbi:MAG: 4-(cytidine 5'-diphospho)-2-C-methyl-D-erythritol kinase [Amylibacter sp.]|nr:4-(cytidine 5'-diphospho)-2-C-methyl-D-erythritol kinase [Amylibacter sp.]